MNSDLTTRLAGRLQLATGGAPADPAGAEALDLELAYDVADATRAAATTAGDTVVGYKIGLTSQPARDRFGATEPAAGYLLASRLLASGESIDTSHLVGPGAEVEIAFLIGTALSGPDVTAADILQATASVAPAFEIVGSRWLGGAGSLPLLVADNTNAAGVVLGERTAPRADLPAVTSTLTIGDRTIAGAATAVLGDPAAAVAWLVRHLARSGGGLAAGDIVLSGTLSPPEPIHPGDRLHAALDGIGEVAAVVA